MSQKLYSVIDVETTGGQPSNSRITDISIFLTDGERIIEEFSSLVNPGMPIPYFITQLTGIDDDMVADAPAFEEIAKQVVELTENTTFVAHNVNFDLGMIHSEFRRLAYDYQRPKLCTVKLARKFIPGHRSYGLGNICGDLDIPINGRHRARGDAEATVELFHRIVELSDGHPTMANETWVKHLPAHINREQVDRLPNSPGVYYLKDAEEEYLEIGSAADVSKKVITLLKSASKKSKQIKSELHSIDFECFNWELTAKLQALDAMENSAPVPQKSSAKKTALQLSLREDLFGYYHLQLEKANGQSNVTFSTKKEAEAFLKMICTKYQLCDHLSDAIQPIHCRALTCKGACRQVESADSYNARVELALSEKGIQGGQYALLDRRKKENIPFIIIEHAEYTGHGVFGPEDVVVGFDDLKNISVRANSSPAKMSIIKDYMTTNKPKMIMRKE